MSNRYGAGAGLPLLDLAALNLLLLRPRLFAAPWMQGQMRNFDDPRSRALCLMAAIRRPDPQAVRILLGLGASPHPLWPGGVQKMDGFDGEMPPLLIAVKLLVLTRDDERLRRQHIESIVALAMAGADIDLACYPDPDYTLRVLMQDRCPEALAAIEVEREGYALRALLDDDAPAGWVRRV